MPTNLFFMGKGGVGKSTSSALHSVFLARKGFRVLLVSLDPAHNQGDIFERRFGDQPVRIADRLFVAEIDQDRWIQTYLKDVHRQINKTYAYLTAFNLDKHFKVIQHSPGLEEYALMLAYSHICRSFADFDFLVFDMPPTALSLKFFSLPSLSLVWLEHLLALRREIIRKRDIITRIKLVKKEHERDKLLNQIEAQKADYQALKDKFEAPDKTRIHLVLNPDRLSHAESRRIFDRLGALNIQVCRIGFNKMPVGAACEAVRDYEPVPVLAFPLSRFPLIGLPTLERFLDENRAEMEDQLAACHLRE